jgi:mycothione reductase
MQEYDVIAVGTGSAAYVVDAMMQRNPEIKAAIIDKDDPGGICLTRGCIPSKILLYPAELVRTIENAGTFGVDLELRKIDFAKVMTRMRKIIDADIESIRRGLSSTPNIDYYHATAEFISPYTLKVANETITSKMIFLSTGSETTIPPIRGLSGVGYKTSDTILYEKELPESIVIIGGGYIAAEYGHFLSAMGSKVTIIGRNPQFLPQEEPEVSALAKRELEKHMTILTNFEVKEAESAPGRMKRIVAVQRETGDRRPVTAREIMVAAGRGPVKDIRPERAGIKTDERGWILVDEFLQTSSPNVWAFGDSNGKYLFKHAANHEASVVYYNSVLNRRVPVDYHAVPHAVFTYPEIASVGLREKEAIEKLGEEKLVIGFERYQDTAKGEAMAVKNYFVKVILERENLRIVGAHVIGPHASILIQEIINLMYTPQQSARPLIDAMHIHPALSEVVQRAFQSLVTPGEYHHTLEHVITHGTSS